MNILNFMGILNDFREKLRRTHLTHISVVVQRRHVQGTPAVVVPGVDLAGPHVQQPPHKVPAARCRRLVQRQVPPGVLQPQLSAVRPDEFDGLELTFGTAAVRGAPPLPVLAVGIGPVGQQEGRCIRVACFTKITGIFMVYIFLNMRGVPKLATTKNKRHFSAYDYINF